MSLMRFGFSRKGKAAATSTIMEEQSGNESLSESSSDDQGESPGPVSRSIAKRSKQSYEATRTRAFKESWKKDFPWVVYDAAMNKMYCSVCREFPTIADGNALFTGMASFRIQNLKAHDSSKTHDNCCKAKTAKSNPAMAPMNLAIRHMESETRDKMTKLFHIAYFVGKEEIPFTKFSKICKLHEKNEVQLGRTYFNSLYAIMPIIVFP